LATINIIDHEGISETFSNADRLKRYEDVDFLAPQPYKKVLRIYQRNADGDILACVTSYHQNGQIKQYLDIVNGRAFGMYQEWHENGALKVEAEVIGGEADVTPSAEKTWLFQGYARAWDNDGRLLAEIPYDKGELKGVSIHYHPNGQVWKKTPFSKNQVNGIAEVFLENGQLLSSSQYMNGIREGLSVRYWDSERVASEEVYSNGKLFSGRYFNLCGELISEIHEGQGFRAIFSKDAVAELHEYRHGVLDGQIKVFGRNQHLIKTYHVKNGFKHGEEVEYFDSFGKNPRPKLMVTWHEARLHGLCKTWYPDGGIESQREMVNNKKHGLLSAWYKDGNIMLLENYENNKLVRGEYYNKGEKSPVTTVNNGKGQATLFDADGHYLSRIKYLNGVPDE
jgi:antitoxin component YwqK of YwqJK toxin-antitoxin module